MTLSPALCDRLVCPGCRAPLAAGGEALRCSNRQCNSVFPAVNGIPILIDPRKSLFDVATFLQQAPTFFKPVGPLRRWLKARSPTLCVNLTARDNFRQLREHLLRRAPRPRVLVVGGSIVGQGMDALADDPAIELVETDVAIGPRTQMICDAHDLPFRDETFDGVTVQAVLEHVLDPVRSVEEVHRVLKADGLVYADTPFIQQVHGREFDFTRFTRLGHRRLFRRFRELSSGITCGPGVALAYSGRYFLLSFCRGRWSRTIAGAISRLAFFWLKYFDYWLVQAPAALDAASAFYFLGEKSQQVLSDRELVRAYRGGL